MSENTSPGRPARHGPCPLRSYLETHETVLNQFRRSEFIGGDSLELTDLHTLLRMEGEIGCRGKIVIHVDKILEFTDDEGKFVQTRYYAYNVLIRGRGNLFRYDNQHEEMLYPGHPDPHHKHEYDLETLSELPDSPIWIGSENWPTLGEVIAEAQAWHADNYAILDDPEAYPQKLQNRP